MSVPKAPDWPTVLISGAVGGLVSLYYQSDSIGVVVFIVLGALLIVLKNNRKKNLAEEA